MSEQRRELREVKAADPIMPRQQIIDRLVGEIQPESDRFFNVGLVIVGIAVSVVITIPSFDNVAVQAALATLVLSLIGGSIVCFIAGREINRARRLTRTILIENVREI